MVPDLRQTRAETHVGWTDVQIHCTRGLTEGPAFGALFPQGLPRSVSAQPKAGSYGALAKANYRLPIGMAASNLAIRDCNISAYLFNSRFL